MRFWVGILTVVMLATATPSLAQLPAMRDRPLSAAERSRLTALEGDIQRISRARNTSAAAVRSIARKLGARLTTDDPKQILDLIDARAGELAEAKTEIDRLEAQLETLDSMRLARAVQPLLEAANAAIEEGELETAEQKLAEAADQFGSARRNLEGQVADLAVREADVIAQRAAVRRAAFDYAGAAALYGQAAEIAPAERGDLRWGYSFDQAIELQRQGADFADLEALRQSALILRDKTLPLASRDTRPADWSETQARLGGVLGLIGERTGDAATVRESLQALRLASQSMPADAPEPARSGLALNLGAALANMGEQENDPTLIRESIAVMTDAAVGAGELRAHLLSSIATSQARLAMRGEPDFTLAQAAASFGVAAAALSDEQVDGFKGTLLMQQAFVLQLIAEQAPTLEAWEAAMAVAEQGLEAAPRDRAPFVWAKLQRLEATILTKVAALHPDERPEALDQAFARLGLAGEIYTQVDTPSDWAALQQDIGVAHLTRGDRDRDPAAYRAAIAAFEQSNAVATLETIPLWRAQNQQKIGEILTRLAALEPGDATLKPAAREAYARGAEAARAAGAEPMAVEMESAARLVV